MANEAVLAKLRGLIDGCLEKSIDELVTHPNWGTINFEEARAELEKAFSILNHLKLLPLEVLPDQAVNNIIQYGQPVYNTVAAIKEFTIEQPNPVDQRNSLVTQLRPAVDTFYVNTHIWIPFLAYQKGDIQRNIQELNKTVSDSTKLLEAAKAEVKKKQLEIDKIISAAREASATVGVGHFTADFNAEANQQATNALKWLKATTAMACLTLVAAGASMFYHPALYSGPHFSDISLRWCLR